MGRRLAVTAAVLAGLVLSGVVALAAYTALKSPFTPSATSANVTENCSPGPCANENGYVLWVSNVHLVNDVVHMTVKFQNSSGATHASPEDLQLIDQSRRASIPLNDGTPGCSTWTRHEFAKKGDTFGPIDVCFRVSNAAAPYVLRWSPDEGAFCCETDLKINLS